MIGAVLLPDVDSEIACSNGSVSGCAWSLTDIPILKALKLLKLAKLTKLTKRTEEGIEDGSDVAKCLHSFVPGTKVLLADGKAKNIEDVGEGDEVLATDPETGETRSKRVTATIHTEDDKHFTALTIQTAHGEEIIIAADTHPFWSPDQERWVDAGDLQPGETLRTARGGSATVVETQHYAKKQETYDLTVDRIHTYYVLAGEAPVLVHNSNCPLHTVGGPRVRPGKDIDVDADGFVNGPTAQQLRSLDVQGLSTFDSVENASRIGLKGQVRAPTGPLPDGLGVIADGRGVGGPRALGHHAILPNASHVVR